MKVIRAWQCVHIDSDTISIQCIRDWRDRTGKGEEVVLSGNIKKCPMCRQSSRFIIPSSIFYAEGSPEKKRTLEKYKASMARVPCRYSLGVQNFNKPGANKVTL